MSAPGMVRAAPNKRTDWATPQDLFDLLDRDWGFTLDGAASAENAKCPRFYTEEDDAFQQEPTGEVIFCNPPYGAGLDKWIDLFRSWSRRNAVIGLLPAATDTKWFAAAFDSADAIHFLIPRVQFVGTTSSNPSGSVVFAWHHIPTFRQYVRVWRWKDELAVR